MTLLCISVLPEAALTVVHTWLVGSGTHDPLKLQVAVITSLGRYPFMQPNCKVEPSSVEL